MTRTCELNVKICIVTIFENAHIGSKSQFESELHTDAISMAGNWTKPLKISTKCSLMTFF